MTGKKLAGSSVWPLAVLTLAAATGLAGCASPDPTYYSLSSRSAATSAGTAPVVSGSLSANAVKAATLYIELQAVHVPERLNRSQIVTYGSGEKADVRDQQRWTSPFPDEFRDALSQQLQVKLHAVDVYQQNGADQLPRYRINIDVVQFDPLPDVLHARISWTLRGSVSDALHSGVTQISVPIAGGKSVASTVEASRAVISQVADDIAAQIIQVPF